MASSSSRARRKQERAEADQAMVTAHRRVRARYLSMVTLSLTLAVIALPAMVRPLDPQDRQLRGGVRGRLPGDRRLVLRATLQASVSGVAGIQTP